MRYAQIRNMDISNGKDIGVSLFVQGCHFHCKNCFNTETWDFNSGKEWNKVTLNHFMKLIEPQFIKRISVLGGEPLAHQNIQEVCNLIKTIRDLYPDRNDKKIWVYTGYKFEDLIANNSDILTNLSILKNIDILVDGQYIDDLKDYNYHWAGSTNQRIIDMQETLKNNNKIKLYE